MVRTTSQGSAIDDPLSRVPNLDEGLRRRLRARYGEPVDSWLDGAPAVLAALGERWELEYGTLIPLGSMSVVVRCRTADDAPAVLKLVPDRARVASEAAALQTWATAHVPRVHAFAPDLGALLLEAIEPGGMVRDALTYPSVESVAELVSSLHHGDAAAGVFPPLTRRTTHLFASWDRQRHLRPDLVDGVPEDLFERGRRFAARLAAEPSSMALLHGDLTAVNVLDGGRRGLVAIDPGPCLGDPAYDVIDLLVWRAPDIATIEARAGRLADAMGIDVARLLDWCSAFGAMFALDMVDEGNDWQTRAAPYLLLASQAPPR